MRLGLTNLAWDPSRDEAVAGLLARLGMDAIDVAPSKYFADVAGDPNTSRVAPSQAPTRHAAARYASIRC